MRRDCVTSALLCLPAKRVRLRLSSTASWAAIAFAVSVISGATASQALADDPSETVTQNVPPLPAVSNPLTGQTESIVQQLTPNLVLTQTGDVILTDTTLNDPIYLPNSTDLYKITGLTTNSDKQVTSVQVTDTVTGIMQTVAVVSNILPSSVYDPTTGSVENVVGMFSTSAVLTANNTVVLLTPSAVGAIVYLPGVTTQYTYLSSGVDSSGNPTLVLQVPNCTDPNTGNPCTVTVEQAETVATAIAEFAMPPGGSNGNQSNSSSPGGAGQNVSFDRVGIGQPGGNGHDGGGIRICFGIFGCITIAYAPTSGGAGAPGPDYHFTLTSADLPAAAPGQAPVHTVSNDTPGITLSSIGGNGGAGGSAYGNIPAASGGAGGAGGTVWLTNEVNITTSGNNSDGIYAQSSAGEGGSGGTGYIASSGGGGGTAAQAGTVTVINYGNITTGFGDPAGGGEGSTGIFAQSLGGAAGGGGSSYGFVADGGGGSPGGNGAEVDVYNYGQIVTQGDFAHGIFAQSIGGTGGDGGTSGGLVALGNSGTSGGNGGVVYVSNSGLIDTFGASARGIFAQSIGGGGGSGGDSTGLAAIGGDGGPGSEGDTVTVDNSGDIVTHGNQSIGIFAQSVGGGGGDGGSSGGPLVSIGGNGSSGGDGAEVQVDNSGLITTYGNDAHAIFAQSVGGGGGNGGNSDSVSAFGGIAIGGKGGAGGMGGTVNISFSGQSQEGQILTEGEDSRGIFAQSVGGGGGAGGAAEQMSVGFTGAVSLAIGGSGGDGGPGGTVNIGDVTDCMVASACYGDQQNDIAIQTKGDNSDGLYAQSVGGGGGAGGYAIASAISAGIGASVSFSTAIGGSGGSGGNGGDVTVRTGGSIVTGTVGGAFVTSNGVQTTQVRNSGEFSTGLLAQSVGGGGGAGGYSLSLSAAAAGGSSLSLATGVGGSGGTAGNGGTVDADFDGSITTYGDDAAGAIIQSVGGGGGAGGYNISASVALGGVVGAAASIGVGGAGGTAGDGGTALGTIGGDVLTMGARSTGVIVQSVGGGGGDGGFNVSGAVGGSGGAGVGIAIGVGGAGGAGGKGGEAKGTTLSQILTEGEDAGGLLVQSVGGGGGNGGFDISGDIGAGGVAGAAISVAVGGSGGAAGAGGYAEGHADGTVETYGDNAAGVTVQSVGGGGGNGGFAVAGGIGAGGTGGGAISVGIGGSGGGGGAAGDVDASAASISTAGDGSDGFLAQSVGGGGGNGGFSIAGSIGAGGTGGGGISVGIGGSASNGGSSGNVTATVTGNVVTLGDQSDAIVAQSLGGGGGNGGFTVAGGIGAGGTGGGAVSVGIGGSGGDGGNSGGVTLTVAGLTQTTGTDSDGIIAQSIGGGGGNGGFSIAGDIAGGGTGAGTAGVSIGGTGGDGGNAGNLSTDKVTLNVTGVAAQVGTDLVAVETQGAGAGAVLAQSVGGGGGNGGFSINGSVALAATGSGNIGVGIGGSGGDGGAGQDVEGNITGDVLTLGASNAAGIMVQSIGGGGGDGGFSIVGGLAASTKGAGNLLVGVGGMGGDGGSSGNVTGTVNGNVETVGSNSAGVTYQSLAGGGGDGGFNITGGISLTSSNSGGAGNIGVGVGGFGGNGSNAGLVDATIIGNIATEGDGSYGALLQSVGGGGGNGGFDITGTFEASSASGGALGFGLGGFGGGGGAGGAVTGVLTGNVETSGDDAYGVMLQSLGGGGGNGGFNVTGAATLTSGSNGSVGVGIGGFGGDGGHAGDVMATVTGAYSTQGANADGIIVQSLGGGGGDGGLNVTGQLSLSTKGNAGQASIGIGGFGGDGGYAGEATLDRTGDTTTTGANSEAILVQSVGGGGGDGGIDVAGGLALTKSDNASVNIGLGGFGGGASSAGDVQANIVGNVWATGLGADTSGSSLFTGALVAQSIGGGGGDGGLNVSGGLSLTQSSGSGKEASIGIGGFAGGGGDAGTVELSVTPPSANPVSVIADGDNRAAVVAQSIGGGGGAGGIDISGGISTNSDLAFGIGGFGADGGQGKDVTADIDADIETTGDGTRGILAQSIGGGGGAGGINVSGTANFTKSDATSITFGLGGFGGAGNVSGAVNLTQNGVVIVNGADGVGVMAQSVAGGGGDGGLNITANITNANPDSGTDRIIAGIGGTAGEGADAGEVTVNSTGAIAIYGPASTALANDPSQAETTVFTSAGILAQSIGGGGGLGGMNISASASRNAGDTLQLGVGGTAGAGGDGNDVTVIRGYDAVTGAADSSVIETIGDYSSGLVAQSVGGGGGNAGMNFDFEVNSASGGSGGESDDKSQAALITIGGSGADAGNGAVVTVHQDGDIDTDGVYSHGIVAQSIGGGGGSSNVNLDLGMLGDKTDGVNIGVGGSNGAAGMGQSVEVDQVGTIYTQGDASIGIEAQSIGGGGGSTNGFNQYVDPALDALTGLLDSSSLEVNIGRAGGSGGQGGEVRVNESGNIFTVGDDSIGIMAQSVGGGGGASGTTTVGGDTSEDSAGYGADLSIGLDGGTGATGGVVSVTTSGEIQTQGARADAIFAQSVGGGGGLGGTVGEKLKVSKVDDDDNSATSAAINIGGKGGSASYALQVTVNNSGDLVTGGDYADGIWAQSIGGTGGDGGDYLQATLQNVSADKTLNSFSFNIGGTGGSGGDGGGVSVSNSGLISTVGVQSFGIRADSVGGGGGDGGAVLQGTLQTGAGSDQSVSINMGGNGGMGGTGGEVDVTNTGIIATTQLGAEGIRATSTGGGGGNAGVILDTQITATSSGSQTQSIAMNIGGIGGTGGTGGDVTVDNLQTAIQGSGVIWTQGDEAHGIFAQSLGGGGGNGSSIVTMTGLKSTEDSVSIGLNLGGSGGSGNSGGTVSVDNSGYIETDGNNAYGIFAQSTGGGGGNGGVVLSAAAAFSSNADAPIVSLGGDGGTGGNGGEVDVINTGTIYTTGTQSHGIVAQSIGGGGGNAGIGITVTNDATSFAVSNTLSLIAGATGGGTGGIGGIVNVTQDGNITVTGEGAQAVVAESINGGGGHIDVNLSGITGLDGVSLKNLFGSDFGLTDTTPVTDPKLDTRLGGDNLSNMNAGKVTVTTTGTFGVAGDNGAGSFSQSLGGGGGSLYLTTLQASATSLGAGFTPTAIAYSVELGETDGTDNSGANLEGQRSGDIYTTGIDSPGVLSQTIGGGGGRAVIDITAESGALVGPIDLSFGSTDGATETGGDILRTENGEVMTTANLSSAILMQSIGGGGGAANVTLYNDAGTSAATSAAVADAASVRSAAATPTPVMVAFGAAAGSGLDGGNITSSFAGGAVTQGDHALGLFVQSVGGGGGEVTIGGDSAAAVTLGGSQSAVGNGGDLTITNSGAVQTTGADSYGVFLQSIGGGGGAVFGAGAGSSVVLSSANIGNGGAISLQQSGSVVVTGPGADGVVAQSLGGGGGWIDGQFAGMAGGAGTGGTINLNLDADVFATGVGGTAVLAQSLGGSGNGDITLQATGMVRGNTAGITLDGGAANTVTTSGSVSAVSGLAISATGGGDNTIFNDGTVVGNIDLGTGMNSFTNRAGSVFVAFNTIKLADPAAAVVPAGATFTNSGDFQMGLSAPIVPINLAQGAVFANQDSNIDPAINLLYGARVINTVTLDGNFVQTAAGHMAFDVAFGPYASDRVNLTGTAQVAGTGTITLTWLSNASPVTLFSAAGGGVDNGLKIDDTLAMDYHIVAGASGIQLTFTSHFDQPFLNRDDQSLGRYMNEAISLGGSDGIGRTMAWLGNLRAGQESTYSYIFSQLDPEPFLAPLIAQDAMVEQFTRDMFGCVTPGDSANRSCNWGHIEDNSLNRTADFDSFGAYGEGQSLSTGFERPLNDRWSVTVALGYDQITDMSAGPAHSDGQSLGVGFGLRRVYADGADLALSLFSDWQTLNTSRYIDVFGPLVGSSRPQTLVQQLALKWGETYRYKSVYARPILNVSGTTLHQDGFQEQGLDGIGVAAQTHTQFIAAAGPELALGYVSAPEDGYSHQLEIDAGRTYRDISRIAMTYGLIGANSSTDPALIDTLIGRSSDHLGVNFDIAQANGLMTMRFSYTMDSSTKLHTNSIGASAKFRF